jgi:predicted permease
MADVLIGTAVPILLLMSIGFFSRKFGILKRGDERVLSAYVYFFALPALFIVDLAETTFVPETLTFILAGITPVLLVVVIYGLLHTIFKIPMNKIYLLTISTIFGSLAFFGIPFVTFAFPTFQTEHLATLAAATISIVAITISITVLEFYQLGESNKFMALKHVTIRLARNPLIISIFLGILISVIGMEIPSLVCNLLHMMGGTTSAVAVFMLGAYLYGKKYTKLKYAFGLSLLRIFFLPTLTLITISFFKLPSMDQSVIVLMNSMPVAVSLSVLSERYNFYRETIASLTLISSVGAIIYLNIWLLLLGI